MTKTNELNNDVLIEVKDLYKNYNNLQVLKGINLKVNRGEVISIIGSSGSGKSTLLRCLNLLEIPQNGQIYYKGNLIFDINTNHEEITNLINEIKDNSSKELKHKLKKEMRIQEKITLKKAYYLEKTINSYREKVGMVFQHFNIYQISFDYPRAILLLEHNFEPLLASILVQNSPNIQTIISFLVVLQNIGYSVQAAKSMHHLLLNSSPKIQDLAKATKSIEKDLKSCSSNQQILQKVAEFERDNKSAGKLSRTQIFYLGLYFKYKSAKSKRGNESIEISANKIINIMSFQNLIANTINEALPQWIKEYNPSKDWQNIIKYILVKETVDLNFPKIQFLLSFTPTCNDSDLNHYYFPPLDEQNQGGFNISFRKNRSNIANFETIVA